MYKLSLPEYDFKLKKSEGTTFILDTIRKKYVKLTLEEWVRQNLIQFLILEKGYPQSLIAVEVGLKLNKLQKRADIVCYNSQGEAILLVECKAPQVKITQAVFEQIAHYNIVFKVKNLLVSNGLEHFSCVIDFNKKSFSFLKDIPHYENNR